MCGEGAGNCPLYGDRQSQMVALPGAAGRIDLMEDPIQRPRLDRTKISVSSSFEDTETLAFWHAQSPEARLRHVEQLRRMNYGHRASARLQRLLEIARR